MVVMGIYFWAAAPLFKYMISISKQSSNTCIVYHCVIYKYYAYGLYYLSSTKRKMCIIFMRTPDVLHVPTTLCFDIFVIQ